MTVSYNFYFGELVSDTHSLVYWTNAHEVLKITITAYISGSTLSDIDINSIQAALIPHETSLEAFYFAVNKKEKRAIQTFGLEQKGIDIELEDISPIYLFLPLILCQIEKASLLFKGDRVSLVLSCKKTGKEYLLDLPRTTTAMRWWSDDEKQRKK